MRMINTGDVFKMARLLKNGNVMQHIKNAYAAGREEGADPQRIGMDLIMDILCACAESKTEEQVYDLLGGICEKKPDEIRNQSLEATVEDIKKICEGNNIANFLRSASRLSANM